MSKVVEFLASLGSNADLSTEAYATALDELDISPELREALARRDVSRLPQLLGAQSPVCIMLAPAEDAPQREDQPQREDEPANEPEEKSQARRHAVS